MSDPRTSLAQEDRLLGDRYRLHELVGEGGMARVYRATDEALDRTVALKIFRAGAADGADSARKQSETRLLASVNHPSLVTLYDACVATDDEAYLVMEFVPGDDLARRIARGPMASADVALVAADLAEALHVVHAAGIIHRDIKPSNVLLRPPLIPGGPHRATLTDFGIAYLVDSARVTTPGMVIGTVAYIAPEQVSGAEPSTAADVYSLGLVLLEALTGTRPFGHVSTQDSLVARLTQDPEIPGALGYRWKSLLTAMTARDPQARPTALAVAQRVRDLDSVSRLPEATQLAAAGAHPEGALAEGAMDPTAVLPTPRPPRTTAVLPLDDPERPAPPRPTPSGRSRARWLVPLIVAVALLVVALLLVVVWTGSGAAPAAVPSLPPLPSPLDGHLRELLREVAP